MSLTATLRRAKRQAPWALVAAIACALVLLPLVPLLYQALKDGAAGLDQLRDYPQAGKIAVDTITLGIGSMLFALVFGTILALCVHSLRPGLRRVAMPIPVIPLLIPGAVHVVGFVFLFSPEVGYVNKLLRETPLFDHLTSGPLNIYSFNWIVAYTGFHLASLVYLFVYNGLEQLGVSSLAAARINGAGTVRAFFTVTLPMLRPVLMYSAGIVFLLSLGQFTGPLFLGRRENVRVVATEMFHLTQEVPIRFPLGAAMGIPLLLVALLVIAVQRRVLRRQERYVGSQARGDLEVTFSRPTQILAATFIGLYTLVAAILPLLALVRVAASKFWSGELTLEGMTGASISKVWDDPVVRQAIWTTIRVALISGAISTALAFIAAYLLFQRQRFWSGISGALDIGVTATLAIPAALLGFGFLFVYIDLGWYGKPWGLIVAFVTVTLPFAVRYQLAGMVSVGQLPVEASMTSGAGFLRCVFVVIAPLIRRNIAASAAIVLVLLTHEFGVSVMLRSPDTAVMSVKLYDFFSGGLYPQVAAMGLIMTIVTAAAVVVALVSGVGRTVRKGH